MLAVPAQMVRLARRVTMDHKDLKDRMVIERFHLSITCHGN